MPKSLKSGKVTTSYGPFESRWWKLSGNALADIPGTIEVSARAPGPGVKFTRVGFASIGATGQRRIGAEWSKVRFETPARKSKARR